LNFEHVSRVFRICCDATLRRQSVGPWPSDRSPSS
jgi:hypothetical protein